jgi:hypothetical protein
MANVLHSSLTGAELHEPKGANTASQDTVYVSNGAGSGAWVNHYTWCESIRNHTWSKTGGSGGTHYDTAIPLAKIPWNATIDALSFNGSFNIASTGGTPTMGLQIYNSSSGVHYTWSRSGTGTSNFFELQTGGSILLPQVTSNTNTYARFYLTLSGPTFSTNTATITNFTIWYRQRN